MKIIINDNKGDLIDELIVPDIDEINNLGNEEEDFNGFLNPSYCKTFRDTINSSPIFYRDPNYLMQYNLCCAVMDRLDTCVRKLNTYEDYPKTEEDFLEFMMFASMVVDAVKEILDQLGVRDKKANVYDSEEDYKYFLQIYRTSKIYNKDVEEITDDKFFGYFRSLSFAHPVETSRYKFIQKNEIQYSPWVIVNRIATTLQGYTDGVGIRIYSSINNDTIDLIIPFKALKEYICSRYERIELATKWAEKQIELAKVKWEKHKVNRSQGPVEVLKEIVDILDSRYEQSYPIKELLLYMRCELTDERNKRSVGLYKKAIVDVLPEICDAVDMMDDNRMSELCNNLNDLPKKIHKAACYQMEKIFCYLGENSTLQPYYNIEWGLIQAQAFYEDFAKKWVYIDSYRMPHIEIQILVRTACFLEKKEEKDENRR